jgi:chorismate dehydratase
LNNKIRVGAVSYLNTKPLTYAFEHGAMNDKLDLHFDYPSKLAGQLMNDEIDIGLIPVAVIPKLKDYHIVQDYHQLQ